MAFVAVHEDGEEEELPVKDLVHRAQDCTRLAFGVCGISCCLPSGDAIVQKRLMQVIIRRDDPSSS